MPLDVQARAVGDVQRAALHDLSTMVNASLQARRHAAELARTFDSPWPGFEAPESAPQDAVHYLMQPWHALELALACEERALRFFGALAKAVKVPAVKRVAREMEEEEREHVALVKAWMAKVPRPAADWATDPDPPRYLD